MTRGDVAVFFAHALALEDEAAQRYEELADTMDGHNNRDVAELFRRMADYSRRHADAVRGRAADATVADVKPWQMGWTDPEGPETAPVERTHYLMTPYHALQLALYNERRGHAYYAEQAKQAADDEVRRLAAEMAEEEAEHVRLLEEWLSRTPEPAPGWDDDFDPPAEAD